MPDEFDSLILQASVLDDFSDTLNELARNLAEIAALEKQVFPIDGEVHIAEALGDIEILEARLRSLDREDIDIDVDVDKSDAAVAQGMAWLFGGGDGDVGGGRGGAGTAAARGVGGGLRGIFGGLDNIDGEPLRRISQELDNFSKARLTMGMVMNVLAALIPLLVVFVGALPAAIGGLGALAAAAFAAAGALAAVGGLGIAAMAFQGGELNVGELQRQIRDLLQTTLESFQPLMEALEPVARGMFQQAAFAIRDIAMRMRVLLQLTDEFNDVIQGVAQSVGPFLQEMVIFAEAVMPTLSLISGGIASLDWFGIFAGAIVDTLPLLVEFTGHMMEILPALFELSLGFFHVTNAVMFAFTAFWNFIGVIDTLLFGELFPFIEFLGIIVSWILVAVTATSLWSIATGALASRISALVLVALKEFTIMLQAAIAHMTGYTIATWQAYVATAALIGVLTLGLAPVLSAISEHFFGIDTSVKNATSSLKEFSRRQNRIGGMQLGMGSGQGYGSAGPQYPSATTVVAPDQETGNALANSIGWKEQKRAEQNNVENRWHSE